MFPLINRKGSSRKLQRKQRLRWQPRLEGLEGRALLSQAVNLLSNGDFSQGDSVFASQYTKWSIDHSNAGWYGVCRNPSIDFNQVFANFGDHTTGTGLMFGANGSDTPNVVAWQETVNVLKATDYVLSGWASSMGNLETTSTPARPACALHQRRADRVGLHDPRSERPMVAVLGALELRDERCRHDSNRRSEYRLDRERFHPGRPLLLHPE